MLPRIQFAHLPTTIETLPRLSAALAGPKLVVKRDDQTGLAFGGNKTRKLEYLLAEAKESGAQTLITAGALQSNHCRQTAAAANRFGFSCTLVLVGDEPKIPSGNFLLDQFLGSDIIWAGDSDRDRVLVQTFESLQKAGREPYLIPYGGSNARGAAAYTYALKEMLDQEINPDYVVIASSSGGTQAGLITGARMFGYNGQVLGISVDNEARQLQERVAALAGDTAKLLGVNETFAAEDILVNDNYLGGGYGVMGEPEAEALNLFARYEGLLLDPVYTARAAAGLIDLIREGFFKREQTVLFWHTGGTPALFAHPYWQKLKSGWSINL
jgi:D-cysteine desulfhydrase family pyridoxal phosphate-dependent enzyme